MLIFRRFLCTEKKSNLWYFVGGSDGLWNIEHSPSRRVGALYSLDEGFNNYSREIRRLHVAMCLTDKRDRWNRAETGRSNYTVEESSERFFEWIEFKNNHESSFSFVQGLYQVPTFSSAHKRIRIIKWSIIFRWLLKWYQTISPTILSMWNKRWNVIIK